jgi:hypothetical protein
VAGPKRYNRDHRDGNEPALVQLVERLGGAWCAGPPLDGWLYFHGRYMPVEIKLPEREGLKHEYTPAQRRWFSWARAHGGSWFVWRTEADVLRDMGGRVAA